MGRFETETINKTYLFERLGAPFHGIVSAGFTTFGLLICIRYFDASDKVKALVAAGTFIGFLFNTYSVSLANRSRRTNTFVLSFLLIVSGLLLVGASLANSLLVFLCFFISAKIVYAQQPPVKTQIYAFNYPARLRGSRAATYLAISAMGAIAFSMLGGMLLDENIEFFRLVIFIMVLACLSNAFLVSHIPSTPLNEPKLGNSLKSISLLWKDPLFGILLGAWMLLGFGNLMMLPLRVEYIANPSYGINASNETVALLTLVIPSVASIACAKLWGVLFDRIHFAVWRIAVNVCFLISIILYFNFSSLWCLVLGALFDGVARGGALVGWSLWVTKIAPPGKTSDYMSIHTLLTGIRGTLAPFLGFYLIYEFHPAVTSWVACALIIASIIIFSFFYKTKRLASVGD